jgi:hypothetical protein
MRAPRSLVFGRPAWPCLLLLAALLVALQGLSSALLAARGPLHAHVPDHSVDATALSDFRRSIEPIAGLAAPHRHEGDGSDRHHHGDDATVLALDDGAAPLVSGTVDDDPRVSHPAFLPLPSSEPRLPVDPAVAVVVGHGVEGWRSLAIAPPERPPRAG